MKVFDWKGRSGYLSRERMAEPSARLGERLMRDSGEVAAYIAARWGVVYGPSGCVALLHLLGFEYKRPDTLPNRSATRSRVIWALSHIIPQKAYPFGSGDGISCFPSPG